MHLSVLPFVSALALLECGGGPLPLAQPESQGSLTTASADVARAGDSGSSSADVTDAAARPVEVSHTIAVTLCSKEKDACQQATALQPMEASYKVVFGSGTGAIRTRRQAMTDLYKEIRERTGWGTQLTAQVHRLDRASTLTKGPSARPSSSEADALAEAAFQFGVGPLLTRDFGELTRWWPCFKRHEQTMQAGVGRGRGGGHLDEGRS